MTRTKSLNRPDLGDEKERSKEANTGNAVQRLDHRMVAVEDCEFFEVSSPEINDVVRIEDRYGRQGTTAG